MQGETSPASSFKSSRFGRIASMSVFSVVILLISLGVVETLNDRPGYPFLLLGAALATLIGVVPRFFSRKGEG